jgi:hypothetical protein
LVSQPGFRFNVFPDMAATRCRRTASCAAGGAITT